MDLDAQAARLGERQYGLLTLTQTRRIGFSEDARRHRVKAGRWLQVRRGVFAIAGAPASRDQQLLAVVLAVGSAAQVSHQTAAEIWGLRLPRHSKIEITVPIQRIVRLEGVTAHRSGTLIELDVTIERGIPVTTPARTLFDVSARFDDSKLGAALDDAPLGDRLLVIDLAYPAQRIAIEVDGFDPRGTRTAFDVDRERQNALVVAGWTVLRFTSQSSDEDVVRTVAGALSVRGGGH